MVYDTFYMNMIKKRFKIGSSIFLNGWTHFKLIFFSSCYDATYSYTATLTRHWSWCQERWSLRVHIQSSNTTGTPQHRPQPCYIKVLFIFESRRIIISNITLDSLYIILNLFLYGGSTLKKIYIFSYSVWT